MIRYLPAGLYIGFARPSNCYKSSKYLTAQSCLKGQNAIATFNIALQHLKIVAMSAPKVLLITGGNTGLGLEIVKSLCRSLTNYDIIIGCRKLSSGDAAIEEVRKEYPSTSSTLSTVQVDLASDDTLEKAVETISSKHGRLDALVNNGGASFDNQIQSGALSIRDGWNKSWDTNVTGTQVLTTLAIPLLLKSSDPRLIFMASGTSSMTETEQHDTEISKRINGSPPNGWPKENMALNTTSYRSTKTGLNMMMREWNRILKNDGVKVWCVSPGFLATGLGGVGAERLKKVRNA